MKSIATAVVLLALAFVRIAVANPPIERTAFDQQLSRE